MLVVCVGRLANAPPYDYHTLPTIISQLTCDPIALTCDQCLDPNSGAFWFGNPDPGA